MNPGDVVWKIQREDGLYSTGGTSPKWSKRGKAWNSLGALKNHLHCLDKRQRDPQKGVYANAKVVELRVSACLFLAFPVSDLIREQDGVKQEKRAKRQAEWEQARRDEEIRKLKELKEKYPDE